jgi:2-oxoglutarate dehydrogenase E2 component (dihydrolipoamide succinyltransferase)
MAKFELKLPKMGESVAEATITTWLKEVGDTIELDDAVVEIATDKVDSEVPSEVEGVLVEKLFDVDDVVQVGQVIAVIETEGEGAIESTPQETTAKVEETPKEAEVLETQIAETVVAGNAIDFSGSSKFYSPLVKNIAATENVSLNELEAISGTGKDGRVTKNDILQFVDDRKNGKIKTT